MALTLVFLKYPDNYIEFKCQYQRFLVWRVNERFYNDFIQYLCYLLIVRRILCLMRVQFESKDVLLNYLYVIDSLQ